MSEKSYHNPQGNPCRLCGKALAYHRVDHVPQGDPCRTCGLSLNYHRHRPERKKKEAHKQKGDPCLLCGKSSRYHHSNAYFKRHSKYNPHREPQEHRTTYLGIDGEGQGRKDHRYVFLACNDESNQLRVSISDSDRELSTRQCLDFILALPKYSYGGKTKIFAYAFQYDLTKILTDVDNASLYKLFRPELRQRPPEESVKGPYPIRWNEYTLNLQASKFSVKKGKKRTVLWDIFKFFQSKFVSAIRDWKIGNEELWNRMQRMKELRPEFDKLDSQEVADYCFEECACMAQLARKLTEAHVSAGLRLRSYFGAGSTATAMLTVMGVKDQLRPIPPDLVLVASKAFFGGRFENSVLGTIRGELFGYDISSAYPYELCFLPCLVHGTWEHTNHRKDLIGPSVVQALVRYTLGKRSGHVPWGPFPFRTKEGNICFPIESGGGWIYLEEYLTGERLFENVQFEEAWIMRSECDCAPFAMIPKYYTERIRIGKEGPGIVIKLGMNSNYGKLAQSVGVAPFNNWLWAGMITSGTRAKLLGMLGLVRDRNSILMMATDGIVSRERIATLIPRDTETWDTRKPLGGWEEKTTIKGMFFARPGIYFPLSPTDKEMDQVRARGVGRSVVLRQSEAIVNAYRAMSPEDVTRKTVSIMKVSRFCGAKSSISQSGVVGNHFYKRSEEYGQWIERDVDMSFNPMPKRKGIGERVSGQNAYTLAIRRISLKLESADYTRAITKEGLELKMCTIEAMEQPDAELIDYE
jgi:DNA polymerase type B, organellar and viral